MKKQLLPKYKKQLMLFKDISGKKVGVDFDGGEMSSDAGLELESELGSVADVVRACHAPYVKHELLERALKKTTCRDG